MTPVEDTLEAARSVLALHSSDPSTVYLSAWARAPQLTQEDIARSLYVDRQLVRIYGMRRTLWVVDRNTHPLVEHSSTKKIAGASRRAFIKALGERDVSTDPEGWLDDVADRTVDLIREQGPLLARDLTKQIPELQTKLEFHNKKGQLIGRVGVSTRVLVHLAMDSRITRAAPAGSWISSQYRWTDMEDWLGHPIPEMDPAEAKARLLENWLARFGPGTEKDMKWWTGWTVTDVRTALETIDAVEVELDSGTGWVLADDVDNTDETGPWVALLPSLDPTTMGWKERAWYLGDREDLLFDRNGNAGPTVWVDGRIVGGWSQRTNGEIVYEILEDVGAEAAAAVEDLAAELQTWVGDVRVTARFRSPHDRKLSS